MAFPLRALMGELSYRTVEIPVGRPARLRRIDPPKGADAPKGRTARVSPVVPGRGQPLLYWRPIAVAGLLTLVVVLFATIVLTTRSRRAASDADNLGPTVMAAAPAELASLPEPLPDEDRPRHVPHALPPRGEESPAAADAMPEPSLPPLPEPAPPAQPVARDSGCSLPSPASPSRTPNLLVDLGENALPAVAPASTCAGNTYGTAVEFARNPAAAAKIAKRDDKLTFLLHVSGNFEDDGFT